MRQWFLGMHGVTSDGFGVEGTCVLEKRQSIVTSEDRDCGHRGIAPPPRGPIGRGLVSYLVVRLTLWQPVTLLCQTRPLPHFMLKEREERMEERERSYQHHKNHDDVYQLSPYTEGSYYSRSHCCHWYCCHKNECVPILSSTIQTFRELHCSQVDTWYHSPFSKTQWNTYFTQNSQNTNWGFFK